MSNKIEKKVTINFTLSQLLLVCICIGLLMSVYFSYIVRRTIENNEGAAVAWLLSISDSQELFKNTSQVDQDRDGSGEFGLLGELAGTTSRRGGGYAAFPYIAPALGPKKTNTYSVISGYRFQVHLPSPSKTKTITDNGVKGVPGLPCSSNINRKAIDEQEIRYRIYAWPDKFGSSGIKSFAIDQSGYIVIASNQGAVPYGGDNVPTVENEIGTKTEEIIPALIMALSDGGPNVRMDAAAVLGGIGPKAEKAIPALIKALSDEDGYVRADAAKALGKIGPKAEKAIPVLAKAFSDWRVRYYAIEALGKLGPKAVPYLIKALSDDDLKSNATYTLGQIGPKAKKAIPNLVKALSDKNANVRSNAAKALEKIDPKGKHYKK